MTTFAQVDQKPHSKDTLQPDVVNRKPVHIALAALRIAIGFTFLWTFLDKLFALGLSTGKDPKTGVVTRFGDAAWIHGGSPTKGFLMNGVPENNPFRGFFTAIAGAPSMDWLFMLGALGVGLALCLGIGVRIAGMAGAAMYLLLWAAMLPLENNPVVDQHLTGAITVAVLALTLSGDTWGLGKTWARTPIVQRMPILR